MMYLGRVRVRVRLRGWGWVRLKPPVIYLRRGEGGGRGPGCVGLQRAGLRGAAAAARRRRTSRG